MRVTVAAGVALAAFIGWWLVFLAAGSDACGNADTVECSPLGWVLLYGWIALAVLAAALIVLAGALWAIAAWARFR
jgi:hypothetical protein